MCGKETRALTKLLEDGSRLLEDDMEVPAASERPYWGLHAVALATDHSDLDWSILALRIHFRNAGVHVLVSVVIR